MHFFFYTSQTHFITKLFTGQNVTNTQIKQEKYFWIETALYHASHLENSFLAQMKLNWALKHILGAIFNSTYN